MSASRRRPDSPLDSAALLELLEPGWRRDLVSGLRAAELAVDPSLPRAAAGALGDQARSRPPARIAATWPACVIVALARVAGERHHSKNPDGSFWPGWHRAAGLRMTRHSSQEWGQSFVIALELLGIGPTHGQESELDPARSQDLPAAVDAILAHATPPPDPSEPSTPSEAAVADAARRPRLDPFGLGVLLAGRPALPEEVADPADPLLVFDAGGEHAGAELPEEPVWVLHPAGMDLRSDVPPRVVVTSRLPLTWRRWRLLQLDLRGVSWLELAAPADDPARGPAAAPVGDAAGDVAAAWPRHPVRGRSRPWLVTGLPMAGVSTPAGEPVYAKPPDVLLPQGPASWRVEIRRAGTGAVLSGLTAAGDGWRPERLWQPVARPVLGRLTVTATAAGGTAGPGMRRTVTVAEGLAASYFPAPRLTSGRGLEPAEAALAAAPGMTVSPQAALVPADAVAVEVTCIAGQVLQRLRVTPPHIRIRIEPEPGAADAPTGWHHAGPLPLDVAGLWRGGALSLDLPGIDRDPPVEVIGQDGEVVQVLEPTRQGRYPLRRMADTVAARGGASLRIIVAGRTATIAQITAPDGPADPWAEQIG